MTTIYLIRHGQASAGAANYDVLSPTGRRQAAVLGEHIRTINLEFDSIYSGNLKRQIDTATIAMQCQPEQLRTSNHFNEYHHHEIFSYYLPRLTQTNEDMADAASAGPNNLMTLSVFTALMNAWTADTDNTAPIESWQSFKDRVITGITDIARSHGPDDSVAVFTSGGVICTVLHAIFDTSSHMTFEMNWGINNAGITSIKSRRHDKLQLREYNNITHLKLQNDSSLVTQI